MLIDHMSQGYSIDSFSAVIKVNKDSLYEWIKVHPEFSDAKSQAFEANRLFWERQGIEGLYATTEYDEETGKPIRSKSMNATVWVFNMKNRFKWSNNDPNPYQAPNEPTQTEHTQKLIDIVAEVVKIKGAK